MDPATAALIGEGLKVSLALWLATKKMEGKTDQEIELELRKEYEKALAFNPATDIKDV